MSKPNDTAIINRAVELFNDFGEVVAVGLSGSRARNDADVYSDFDFVVLAREDIPSAQRRKRQYESRGVADFPYFDVDHQVCIDDGLTIDGVRCEIIWMSVPFMRSYLAALDREFDCDEFLPGGLLRTKPLFDPDNVIDALKAAVPPYSRERALYRIRKHLRNAHFHIYVLGWFDKAAFRNDHFSFFRHARDAIEDFIACSFALNRRWFSDEKGVIGIVDTFELMPENASERLTSVITHTGENADLNQCLRNLKGLFREISAIADLQYPNSGFPLHWQ
jgi:predicted nucleotidyltransferase